MNTRLSVLPPLFRLLLAVLLLVLMMPGWPTVQAHIEMQQLAPLDVHASARQLAAEARFGEALMVLDLAPEGPETERLRAAITSARQDWRYRSQQWARGAWYGEGDSVEALAGAVMADLLVFGDVRDLVIQGRRAATGAPTDPVIVALSSAGLLLTAAPSVDAGAAVLKVARRSGALGSRMSRQLRTLAGNALRRGETAPLRRVLKETGDLVADTDPVVAVRLLRAARGVEDLPRLRRLARDPGARYALWADGEAALTLSRRYGDAAIPLLRRAARHGKAGLRFAVDNSARLLRPHPFIGLLKGLYKGHLPRLLAAAWPSLLVILQALVSAIALLSALQVWAALRRRRT